MIETITHNDSTVAIIIYKDHHTPGIEFITPENFSLQLGSMTRPAGYEIVPHIHNLVQRETIGTQEVLFIRSGRIEIDFYSFEQEYLQSRVLTAGDTVLLAGAGHGINIMEESEIIEVKNGPFVAGSDKGRFAGKRGK
ncbi:MAG: hypothetical protein PHV60_10245 [bacterium]|nr:hypothetical protein [bacterium]